jgi:hypothetical protein
MGLARLASGGHSAPKHGHGSSGLKMGATHEGQQGTDGWRQILQDASRHKIGVKFTKKPLIALFFDRLSAKPEALFLLLSIET